MIERTVMQNTSHYWFAQGDPETAQAAARDLLGACDEFKVHHHVTKQRNVGVRYEGRTTKGRSKTQDGKKTESSSYTEVTIPVYQDYEEPVYQSGSEQLLWQAKAIQQNPIGTCFAREMGSAPYKINVPLVGDSWVFPAIPELGIESLSAKKVKECLSFVKTKPEYQTPQPVVPPGRKTPTPMQRRGTNGSNGSSKNGASRPRSTL